MVTFEENFKSKDDLRFALYFDFKTTAPTDNYFDPEQTKMFVVSHALIVSFHPKLKIPKIVVERSYAHPLKELTSISYLTGDQLHNYLYSNQLGFFFHTDFLLKHQFQDIMA